MVCSTYHDSTLVQLEIVGAEMEHGLSIRRMVTEPISSDPLVIERDNIQKLTFLTVLRIRHFLGQIWKSEAPEPAPKKMVWPEAKRRFRLC